MTVTIKENLWMSFYGKCDKLRIIYSEIIYNHVIMFTIFFGVKK